MQRGCDACDDIDKLPRQTIVLPNGGLALYHLGCVPETSHDTSGLHPQLVQLVHAHEQATGTDSEGHDLGGVGDLVAQGVPFTVEEMTVNDRPIAEVSAELVVADG